MAYNKAIAEIKWKYWKAEEEMILRKSGMDEGDIEILRRMDWEDFNSDRRFQEHCILEPQYIDCQAITFEQIIQRVDIYSEKILLEALDRKPLRDVLKQTDPDTLKMLLAKMNGSTYSELAISMGTTEQAIYSRFSRLRKNIKKIL